MGLGEVLVWGFGGILFDTFSSFPILFLGNFPCVLFFFSSFSSFGGGSSGVFLVAQAPIGKW